MRPLGQAIVLIAVLPAGAQPKTSPKTKVPAFSGKDALTYTKTVADFGPRPSGSPELERTRKFIVSALASWKLKPETDSFTASTPIGKIPMTNLIVKIPGTTDRVVIVAGHYDTKRFKEFKFFGANDGGSSTGVLLELARVLSLSPKKDVSIWIVFHDGEEAQEGPWTDADSLHGSKHLAGKLQTSG